MVADLELCLQHYRKGGWASAQHHARRCAESLSLALLESIEGWAPRKRTSLTLGDYVQELQHHLRIDVPLQRAFQMVQAAGNQGSHVHQKRDEEPNQRGAELCTSNLVIIVEWFIETTGVSSDEASRAVAELRLCFATGRLATRSASSEGSSHVFSGAPTGGAASAVHQPFARKTPMPRAFADWYQDVRPELRKVLGVRIDELERSEGWLQPDGRATPALHVCLVGQAAVGKSTLVNCLVSDQLSILPSGGVGPHTASAIVVRYSADPHAEVRYVGLDRVRLLQDHLRRNPTPEVLAAARIVVEGDQFSSMPPGELCRRIEALLEPPVSTSTPHELEVWSALSAIRAGNQTIRYMAGEDLPGFSAALERHASGVLAPMTEAVEVGWDADMLAPGLCLVDLPGFGVAGDKHSMVTQRELQRARAVLWVVDRSGLMEGTLQELRRIEMFRRVASGADDAPVLTIAVTRLDETAGDARKRSTAGRHRSFDQALTDVARGARDMIHAQLREALGHLDRVERDRVHEQVAIHAVAPVEHRRFHLRDEEEPARVTDPELTGIPALRKHLRGQAARRRARAATQIESLLLAAHTSVQAPLARRLYDELLVVTPDQSPQGLG